MIFKNKKGNDILNKIIDFILDSMASNNFTINLYLYKALLYLIIYSILKQSFDFLSIFYYTLL